MKSIQTEPAPPPDSERYSLWSEYTPYATLQDPGLLSELARRRIALAVAVTPPLKSQLVAVVRACRAAGVAVALWPMLSDAEGRWASVANAAAYCRFATGLLDLLSDHALLPQGLALDLEPPIERMRRFTEGPWRTRATASAPGTTPPAQGGQPAAAHLAARAADAAAAHFAALAADATARGLTVLAAVVPPVVLDPEAAARGWQRLLQTPIAELPLHRISTMAYTSLLEGYSRGMLRRRDARALLWTIARATRARHGARASISLGAVGTGALGDERTYRSPAELVDDVSIARAAGICHLALFNLDGALARPPLSAWLDALVNTGPAAAPPPTTRRASLLWHALRAVGYLGRLATSG